jgi:putative ABC transport system permease protein
VRRTRRALILFIALATVAGAAAQDATPPEILVSRQLAQAEHLKVGQLIRLSTDAAGTRSRAFRIAGVYEPTPDPSRLGIAPREVRLHLPDLLALTRDPQMPAGSEYVEAINVSLAKGEDPERFARDLNVRTPGIAARPSKGAENTAPFVVLERFHYAIAIVTIVASTVFLLALTIMLVDERRETVGVLRLIGLPSRRILVQILIEGLLIASAGALFGVALALAGEGLINRFFQWRYDTALIFVRVTPNVAAVSVGIAVPLGAAATVVASWALLKKSGLRLARR